MGPRSSAPNGRERKPTAKTASEESSEIPGAAEGKNSVPMIAAK